MQRAGKRRKRIPNAPAAQVPTLAVEHEQCIRELKDIGFGDQLTDLRSTWTASKARVVQWEAEGRLRIRQRAGNMQHGSVRPQGDFQVGL